MRLDRDDIIVPFRKFGRNRLVVRERTGASTRPTSLTRIVTFFCASFEWQVRVAGGKWKSITSAAHHWPDLCGDQLRNRRLACGQDCRDCLYARFRRRMRHWIPPEVVRQRVSLAEEMNRILTATINRLDNK